jgi:hypothetical protein
VAIPKETSKELFVTVESESVDVVISPPVLDAVIVVGHPPLPDPETLYAVEYNGDVLIIKTYSGLYYTIGDASELPVVIREQVLTGTVDPTVGGIVGGSSGRIYIDSQTNSINVWDEGEPWKGPQVKSGVTVPQEGNSKDMFINTETNSLLVWLP